jgi:hypothetical protein
MCSAPKIIPRPFRYIPVGGRQENLDHSKKNVYSLRTTSDEIMKENEQVRDFMDRKDRSDSFLIFKTMTILSSCLLHSIKTGIY